VAYLNAGPQQPADDANLTRIGCAGAFEVLRSDQEPLDAVLYLRAVGGDVHRFEAGLTFEIVSHAVDRPQALVALDARYHLAAVWVPSVYSSTSAVLFVADAAASAPDVVYAVDVSRTPAGDSIGEYALAADDAPPVDGDLAARAEQAGLHTDLVVDGQRYVLVDVFVPVGTTQNGFVTIFGTPGESPPTVLGRDQRNLAELLVMQADAPLSTDR
jgi:hypothetical protein